jgi:hypothetical protein
MGSFGPGVKVTASPAVMGRLHGFPARLLSHVKGKS